MAAKVTGPHNEKLLQDGNNIAMEEKTKYTHTISTHIHRAHTRHARADRPNQSQCPTAGRLERDGPKRSVMRKKYRRRRNC